MKFITALFGNGSPKKMGKQYMKVGKNALFGIKPSGIKEIYAEKGPTPLSLLLSRKGKVKHSRIAVILFGLFALAIGIILSSIPWVDYVLMKQLRLWNGSLSFQYWQKPGVVRLTKVYIFNVTNTDGFLNFGEKPKVEEVGPFVYKEDMEKVNIAFHDNGTVTYQHKKILNFMPEMSKDGDLRVMVPNIPLLRNGTLSEVHTIYTGEKGMKNFGLLNKLNGMDTLPFWPKEPCNSISASEGSFFPPRDTTGSDIVHLWDKDICRILPLQYRGPADKTGIRADLYTPTDTIFDPPSEETPDNECFCQDEPENCPVRGLQNISPCQYSAPVYLSWPHFYKAAPELLDAVEGLTPKQELHETYFKIQPKLGVPVEGKVRVQLNLKVENQPAISAAANFPDIVFPIMWLEEGIDELTPPIRRWMYLSTTFMDVAAPCFAYGLTLIGFAILTTVVVKTYKSVKFAREIVELSRRTEKKGSYLLVNGQHRLIIARDSYLCLNEHYPSTVESVAV
ncbi:scavenger receptor class B member 1 isoform X2 [Neodiprion pinetum]|uniref:Scavenger receptor class B member 1 isoform X2 n=1 Tax=Neodiprion lecontei TaxID=441921 RepID=A0ABM3G1N9_NEOLC|nr:scavenger receptor class B member 1 isoform X2 [Neodiprion fabricii]XP_046476954.1 scavenger receptor class B member 1 isoform X2 [Neodiprion pinetum]XP_046594175.1 scavenger receptor class B member 1 isoform X2 [Neodiprion lecontei]XP_046615988.1 scavenger receptor class B member 1 isoform X2 [Neodiprion virginianus]